MRFVRDIMTLQVGGVTMNALNLAKSIVFARLLGLEGFGQYAVALTVTGVCEIFLNLGQNQALLIFFAEEYGKKNKDGMARIMQYFFVLTAIAFCILMAFILLAQVMANAFYHDANLGILLRLEFAGAVIGLFTPFFQAMLQVTRKIVLLTSMQNADAALQLVICTSILLLGSGVKGIFFGVILSNIIMLVLYISLYTSLRKKFELPTLREIRSVKGKKSAYFVQGFWIAFDKNMATFLNQGIFMVLSLLAPRSTVGIAQLAMKVGSIPQMLFMTQVTQMLMSTIPTSAAKGMAALRQSCARITKHALFVHAAVTLVALPVIPFFIFFFYGNKYTQVIEPALWIAVVQLMSALAVVNTPLFRLFRKAHIPAITRAIVFPFEILALIVVSRAFSPIAGFVVAFLVSYASNHILSIYVYFFLRKKDIDVTFGSTDSLAA